MQGLSVHRNLYGVHLSWVAGTVNTTMGMGGGTHAIQFLLPSINSQVISGWVDKLLN